MFSYHHPRYSFTCKSIILYSNNIFNSWLLYFYIYLHYFLIARFFDSSYRYKIILVLYYSRTWLLLFIIILILTGLREFIIYILMGLTFRITFLYPTTDKVGAFIFIFLFILLVTIIWAYLKISITVTCFFSSFHYPARNAKLYYITLITVLQYESLC